MTPFVAVDKPKIIIKPLASEHTLIFEEEVKMAMIMSSPPGRCATCHQQAFNRLIWIRLPIYGLIVGFEDHLIASDFSDAVADSGIVALRMIHCSMSGAMLCEISVTCKEDFVVCETPVFGTRAPKRVKTTYGYR